MPITTKCSQCGKTLRAPDTAAGKRAKCPECGHVIAIPAPEAEIEEYDDTFEDYDDYGDESFEPAPAKKPARKGDDGRKRIPCPMCGEMIVATAQKCRFCGEPVGATGGKRKQKGRYDASLGVVRKGIATIYYGLATLLGSAILFAILLIAIRGAGPGAAKMVAILGGIGIIGGAIAMLVGKFMCLGVPSKVGGGATAMIWISCVIDVIGIITDVLQGTMGMPTEIVLLMTVAKMAGTVLFLLFLRRLALFIDRPDLAKLAITTLIMMGVTLGLFLLIAVMMLAAIGNAMQGGGGAKGIAGAAGILGLITIIVGIVTLCIYARLLSYLKDALKP